MSKKPKREAPIIPRQGPPTNLRPAGAHKDARYLPRSEAERAALEGERCADAAESS